MYVYILCDIGTYHVHGGGGEVARLPQSHEGVDILHCIQHLIWQLCLLALYVVNNALCRVVAAVHVWFPLGIQDKGR